MHTTKILERHDISDIIGLRVVIVNAARSIANPEGETIIEIPDMQGLAVAAAMARILLPIRLRGNEMRTIRHIADLTAGVLAKRMGDKTSPETISRWEHEKQSIGGFAEKVFRLVISQALHHHAPGIEFRDGMIACMNVIDPWRVNPGFVVPEITLGRIIKRRSSELIGVWGLEMPRGEPDSETEADKNIPQTEQIDISVLLPAHAARKIIMHRKEPERPLPVLTFSAELSVQQAMDFLNVSCPFVLSLIESGKLPARNAGRSHRIKLNDLVAYEKVMLAQQKAASEEMAKISQELNLE